MEQKTSIKRFSESEKNILLKAYQVGPKVIQRIEQIGICKLSDLAGQTPEDICFLISIEQGNTV